MPSASTRYECLSPGVRALLGILASTGRRTAAVRARNITSCDWNETLAIALRHGVAPLLHRALQSADALAALPDDVRARLEEERRATALDNLRNYGEFRRVARALAEQHIPVIALKGLHLAELVYRDISLRPMGDMDILVPHSMVEPTVAVLRGLGFEPDRGVPSAYCIDLTQRGSGVLVEVHWTLANPTEAYTPPIDDIWRRAVPATLGDADTLVMSPEFLLLYVCAHLAHHHHFAADFRALCDIANIIDSGHTLDWALVLNEGRQHGWGQGVAAALTRNLQRGRIYEHR